MYELKWSQDVLASFRNKYALSCAEACRLYRISDDALIRAIQNGSERWRGFKSLAKHLNKSFKIYWRHFYTQVEVRGKYHTFDKYLKEQLKKRQYPGLIDLVDTEIQGDLFL